MQLDGLDEKIKNEIKEQVESIAIAASMMGYVVEFDEAVNYFDLSIKGPDHGILNLSSERRLTFLFNKDQDGNKRLSIITFRFAITQISLYEHLGKSRVVRYSDGKLSKPIKILINSLGKSDETSHEWN